MADTSAKSEQVQISQSHLECPICCCRFTEPKILDCLHSFCLNCLDELISRQQPESAKITCPVCRRETVVPDTGLKGLANCFFLSSLVDEVNKQEQLLKEASVDPPICEECDEALEAVSRCLDCNEMICLKCQENHQKLTFTKKHRILEFGQHQTKVSAVNSTNNETPKCTVHPNDEISYYCETCQTLSCAKCVVTNHRTADHNLREISDAIRSFRQDVDEILQKYKCSKEQFKLSEDSIKHVMNRLQIMIARASADISAKEEEEIAKIRNKSRLLRDKVTKIGEERQKRHDELLTSNRLKMDEAEQIRSTVSDLMQQTDDFELLDLKPKVMHNLEFQKELEFERAKHDLSFIGVKCHAVVTETDLGEVLHEEKWQLKEEFDKKGTLSDGGEFVFARGVACFSNGDIAVTDTNKHQLMTFTSAGRYKTTVGQRKGEDKLESPFGIAVTQNDLLLVTDKRTVKVFDSDLKYIRQFTPSQDDVEAESESDLTGISVNEKNQVAVSDKGGKLISVHNLDGSLISTIPSDMVNYDVAISNKEYMICTYYEDMKLICTDTMGKEVFNVSPSFDGKPVYTGVCCDDAGDIYVTVHLTNKTRGTGEVHHYDPEGVFVGRVAHGLNNPLGLAFTPCGDLAVADRKSVKIFERV